MDDSAGDPRDIEGMTWAQMMRATGYSEASATVMREGLLEQRRFDEHIYAEEDDLGAIVRGLLYVEHDLRKILTEGPVVNASAIGLDKAGGPQMASLALALGLISEKTVRSVKKLAAIRNEFAHQLDRNLTPEEVNAFITSLPERNAGAYTRFLRIASAAGTNDVLNIHLQMRVAIQTLRSELNLCGWDNWAVRNPDIFNASSEGNDGAAG